MAKVLTISAKCSDLCNSVLEEHENFYNEIAGYPPQIDDLCGGDYINFQLDIETGKIVGWTKEHTKQVEKAFGLE